MSSKEVHFSDLSGEMITDPNQLASMMVTDHPDLDYPVRLDVRPDEVAQIGDKALKAVIVEVSLPTDEQASRYVLAEREFDKLARGRSMKEILADATPYVAAAVMTRRSHNRRTDGGPLTDYTLPENAGLPHKGKVSPKEAEYVRANLEAVNARLSAQGIRTIDPADSELAKRYGFDSTSSQPAPGASESGA